MPSARTAVAASTGLKRALLYLRVSTPSQVNNDFNPEGISIPAQREAGTAKARDMGAAVVGEYVEPGRTATEIDKRPVYQQMVARIRSERDVDFVIVYQFSRIFRNALEASIAKNELRKLGVRTRTEIDEEKYAILDLLRERRGSGGGECPSGGEASAESQAAV